jgi:ATP-dependent helicase YprA (DUF1998 family)
VSRVDHDRARHEDEDDHEREELPAVLHRVRVLSAFDEGIVSEPAVPPASQRGVNLQRADLVVHLDLPASESEFVQRNGRAARIGSRHQRVDVLVPYLAGTVDETWTRALLAGGERALDSLAERTRQETCPEMTLAAFYGAAVLCILDRRRRWMRTP